MKSDIVLKELSNFVINSENRYQAHEKIKNKY